MDSSEKGFCLILTAVDSGEAARRLAAALVENRLCACVSVVPGVFSRYRWQGRLESAEEHLLLAKTMDSRYPDVESFLQREHPYECPEILRIPVEGGFAPYLQWMRDSLEQERGDDPPDG